VEIYDKRDGYIAEALKVEGFSPFSLGEEEKYPSHTKIYVKSLLTEVTIDFAEKLEDNSYLFSRGVSGEVKTILEKKKIRHYNILEDEVFIVKNAYLTAEGALGYVIFNTEESLRRLSVLVLGYGRVGKSAVKVFKDNYAFVAVATDDTIEFSTASIVADEVYTLSGIGQRIAAYSVIVNTVPKKILEGELIKLVNKDCFILDLASKPGGVDSEEAKNLGLNVLHALGVPGKVAPKTAGLYIKDIIIKALKKDLI
jgi:dipicolinate synthase subunit A